ncbi:MAG: trpS, partial [Frankiales bacterium]|nr:trpS [Frankiales bacterium]
DDKPGVTNLLTILSAATGSSVAQLEVAFEGRGYGDLKGAVAEALVEWLAPVRERYAALIGDPGHLDDVLRDGAARAGERAVVTMTAVRERVGLLRAPR